MQKITLRFTRLLSATATAGALVLAMPLAHAQAQPAASAPQAVGGEAAANLTAKVVKIHPDSNSVAVQGPKGKTVVIDVDPATADVKKLKVGDEVDIAYRAAVLMSVDTVDPKGMRARATAESTSAASNGLVVKTRTVQVVATIQKLDRKTREVTLAGPNRKVSMMVQPDVDLSKLKIGDSILATYVGATAISVKRNGEIVK
ncbi:MAG TPA: hypothetical protein VJS30_10680 [Paraburkholderia sp.]|nr:hypothetical protein [Paraburkholderia sp.]